MTSLSKSCSRFCNPLALSRIRIVKLGNNQNVQLRSLQSLRTTLSGRRISAKRTLFPFSLHAAPIGQGDDLGSLAQTIRKGSSYGRFAGEQTSCLLIKLGNHGHREISGSNKGSVVLWSSTPKPLAVLQILS